MSDAGFEAWLESQALASAAGIAACLSRTDLTRRRSGFGRTVTPAAGSVIAAPATEPTADQPDYFFHWTRDAALIMSAVPDLVRTGDRSADWPRLFRDWIAFETALGSLDGRLVAEAGTYRQGVDPDFTQFLRPESELAALHGAAVSGDVRFDPDGTLDTINWSRPQHDGPALRALTALRLMQAGLDAPGAASLIEADLDYTEANAGSAGFDVWEECRAVHYDTVLVQYAALLAGGRHAAAEALVPLLDSFAAAGMMRCALPPESRKTLDTAVILGVLHAALPEGPHSVADPRVRVVMAALERHFASTWPINRGRSEGILCGRYPGDRYVTGGPWYIASFAMAEFRYRCAAESGSESRRLITEGNAILAAARRTIPPSGALSEQINPFDGTQASARNLGWSHAAFLTALAARRAVIF